jgi:hypothetical protein
MFEDYYMPEFDADYFNSPAFQQAIAAAVQQYSPTPVAAPVYTPPAQSFRGISRRGEYDYYKPGIGFLPEDIYTPDIQPELPMYVEPERPMYVEPEPVRTPAVQPMTVEAEPIMGIGSPAVAAQAEAPSVIETAAAAPAAAPATGTGLQVINANDYSPSDTDLQTMGLSRDKQF